MNSYCVLGDSADEDISSYSADDYAWFFKDKVDFVCVCLLL